MSKEHPAAVVAFEEIIRKAHLRIVKRHFLLNEDNEPTHWYFYVGRLGYPDPTFPDVGVIAFDNEEDAAMGARAAENIVATVRRRHE